MIIDQHAFGLEGVHNTWADYVTQSLVGEIYAHGVVYGGLRDLHYGNKLVVGWLVVGAHVLASFSAAGCKASTHPPQ
jgi:hypothetical protein